MIIKSNQQHSSRGPFKFYLLLLLSGHFLGSCADEKSISHRSDGEIESMDVEQASGEFASAQSVLMHHIGTADESLDLYHGSRNETIAPVLLDADALKVIYARVFGLTSPRGAYTPTEIAASQSEFFTDEEKAALGTYTLSAREVNDRVSSTSTNFTITYTKTLRVFLGSACLALVEKEWPKAVDGGDTSQNVLIKRQGSPTVSDVNGFLKRILSTTQTDVINGTNAYKSAFQRNLDTCNCTISAEVLQINYRLLCVAIGEDPRVYWR